MARDLTAGMITELTAGTLRPALFFRGVFTGGVVRLWDGAGTLNYNIGDGDGAQDWTGAGQLLGITAVEETADLRAAGVQVSLSGIPASLISTALGEARQGQSGKIWLACLDAAGAVVASPYLIFQGRLDVPRVSLGGETASITISYESRLIDLERPRERRYTHEDQKLVDATDRGFEYVEGLQEAQLAWGRG